MLLLLFVAAARIMPGLTRPAVPGDDCGRLTATDVVAMERCLRQRPDDIELMIDLANQYRAGGQLERAAEALRRAIAVDPNDGELRRRLGALQ